MENTENQPIVPNEPVLEMPEMKKNHTLLAVIISVVVTAAVAGGGVYFWQNMEIKKVQDNLTTAQNNFVNAEQTLKQQITDLQTQLEEKSQAITSSAEYVALMDQLKETKFKLALTSRNAVMPTIYADPQNKNRFYFITQEDLNEGGSNQSIWYYDFMNDSSFQKDGTIDIIDGHTLVYGEKLTKDQEFRGLGIVDNKFIFAETHFEDTPAVCAPRWISYNSMYYVELGIENPTKKDYTLSEEQKAAEQKEFEDCQKSLQ